MEDCGKWYGALFQKQAGSANIFCSVDASKDVGQTANMQYLFLPAQPCANVKDLLND